MVRPARMRCSRGGGELLDSHTDWFERPVFVLFTAETVGEGSVCRIDRLLETNWVVLVEVALLRAGLADDVCGYVVGVIVCEHWATKCGSERHIVLRIGGGGQD